MVGALSAWVAGASRMPWPVFAAWNAAGCIAWATSIGLAGYALGAAATAAFTTVFFVGVVVAVLIAAAARHRRRRAGI